jgi:hypothetical protein
MTSSRLFVAQLNDMPIAEGSQDLVLSEHPQLLIVCLLLGLFLCGGIFLYTNQVRGKATLLAENSYSAGSAAEMMPPSNPVGSRPVPQTVAIDRAQPSEASLDARRSKQSGLTVNHKLATEHSRNQLQSSRVALSRPGWRKMFQTPAVRGSASVPLSRSRSRNTFLGHRRTTLIALWRQSLKRHQNDKLSHLTSNPST